MYCEQCGSEVGTTARYCRTCGRAVDATTGPVSATSASPVPGSQRARPRDILMIVFAAIWLLLVPEVNNFRWGGVFSGAGLADLTMTAVPTFAIAYWTAARRNNRNWSRFAKWLLVGAFIAEAAYAAIQRQAHQP